MLLVLKQVLKEADDVDTFLWEPSQPIYWQAGQYMKYTLAHDEVDDRGVDRWFTISAAPFETNPSITTRFAPEHGSSFKHALKQYKLGDVIEAEMPEGDFLMDTKRPAVLVAGGIGITPFRAMLLQMQHDHRSIHARLLYANHDEQFVFRDELELVAKNNDLKIDYFAAQRIEVEDILQAAEGLEDPIFYISGPKPMVQTYKDELAQRGISMDNIKTDYFPGY